VRARLSAAVPSAWLAALRLLGLDRHGVEFARHCEKRLAYRVGVGQSAGEPPTLGGFGAVVLSGGWQAGSPAGAPRLRLGDEAPMPESTPRPAIGCPRAPGLAWPAARSANAPC
jgi:hypothetical protein